MTLLHSFLSGGLLSKSWIGNLCSLAPWLSLHFLSHEFQDSDFLLLGLGGQWVAHFRLGLYQMEWSFFRLQWTPPAPGCQRTRCQGVRLVLTCFPVCFLFVCFFYFFMQDLSSQTRGWTFSPSGSPLDHQGSSSHLVLFPICSSRTPQGKGKAALSFYLPLLVQWQGV